MNSSLYTLLEAIDYDKERSQIFDTIIHQLAIDTRSITDGEHTMFFCLDGTKTDGHHYIKQGIEQGIRTFVVRYIPTEELYDKISFVVVKNPLEAMQSIASLHRQQFSLPVVGITGSNGKTQVKEWISQLLYQQHALIKSPRSFNSQIGVPLSVQNIEKRHDLALFEAGISLPKEMERLEKIIQPTIGILTHMGDAHVSNFHDHIHLLEEKLHLFQHVNKLIYADTLGWVKETVEKNIPERDRRFVVSYDCPDADVRILKCEVQSSQSVISLEYKKETYTYTIPYVDESAIENSILCAAFVIFQGAWNQNTIKRFESLERISLRLEIKDGLQNATIIDDSYNSDLLSLSVALNFQEQNNKEKKGKIVVLSDLSEQRKENEEEIYHQVASLLKKHNIDQLYAVGPRLYHYKHLFKQADAKFYLTTEQLIQAIPHIRIAHQNILIKGTRSFRLEEFSYQIQAKTHQTSLEINLDAMRENLLYYRSLLSSSTKMMAMVKASSYGTGSIEVAHLLQNSGIDYLAVAIADEGIELRKANIRTPIVVMNPEKHAFDLMIEYQLEPNIYDFTLLEDFALAAEKNDKYNIPIHIKLDTGMRRLGFDCKEEILQLASRIKNYNRLTVRSCFTHLAVSDTPGEEEFTFHQLDKFSSFASLLEEELEYKILKHALNTAGMERFTEHQHDMVRLGLGLYGVSFFKQDHLTEVMTLKTQISQIKVINKEDTVGYGRHGKRADGGKIAILPIGYADGYNRKLGNGHHSVMIKGHLAPTIGNICMDMCMVDITDIPDVKIGDMVTIFGPEHGVRHISDALETIPYEVMTGIGERVKKIYISER
ncbi:MAG: bifunctional UDP-N-acetylmuramoyl-tripeptide:D-alanyl-D-alanine ligase/alanine racemase [Prolixibacteraceae bacterium]